jgi:hypothetical protein
MAFRHLRIPPPEDSAACVTQTAKDQDCEPRQVGASFSVIVAV